MLGFLNDDDDDDKGHGICMARRIRKGIARK